ncbi:MAG TPA: hypothetical protein VEV83_19940 [Parafilimonas sp.]|nr:hypothetical protein [Parafilimonas sp.]
MNTNTTFKIDFDYALSENILIRLTATVQPQHSIPHYLVTNFHFRTNPEGSPPLPDISVLALKRQGTISWVHTDSRKETMLSVAVGKAIERTVSVEFANDRQLNADHGSSTHK